MSKTSYTTFSRRLRPLTFSDVVGQTVPITVLKTAIAKNTVPHAILFHGLHGTGKTTLARIIAKTLNCENAEDSAPCNSCQSCSLILEDAHPDVREIDAASRTSVEDIREIIESVPYQPSISTHKVYIIDEVHMLSKSAFNALLKTLEEPPSHVKFIFATTEIEKVPATTLSRCLILDLSPITSEEMFAYLKKISQEENLAISEDVLQLVTQNAHGSARDAVMSLEKLVHFSGDQTINLESAQNILSTISLKAALEILQDLLKANTLSVTTQAHNFFQKGVRPLQAMSTILDALFTVTMFKNSQKLPVNIEHCSAIVEDIQKDYTLPFLLLAWQILLRAIEEIKVAHNAEQAFHIAVLRFSDTKLLQEGLSAAPSPELYQEIAQSVKNVFPDAQVTITKGPSNDNIE